MLMYFYDDLEHINLRHSIVGGFYIYPGLGFCFVYPKKYIDVL